MSCCPSSFSASSHCFTLPCLAALISAIGPSPSPLLSPLPHFKIKVSMRDKKKTPLNKRPCLLCCHNSLCIISGNAGRVLSQSLSPCMCVYPPRFLVCRSGATDTLCICASELLNDLPPFVHAAAQKDMMAAGQRQLGRRTKCLMARARHIGTFRVLRA